MTQPVFLNGILNGRVAFVTGGGTGITGGVARALAEAEHPFRSLAASLNILNPPLQQSMSTAEKQLQ
jgi:NADP-dependent 3-hydroxy acid dehydrogenase YdfG